MQSVAKGGWDREETNKMNSSNINEIGFLYLALNHAAAFERAVLTAAPESLRWPVCLANSASDAGTFDQTTRPASSE